LSTFSQEVGKTLRAREGQRYLDMRGVAYPDSYEIVLFVGEAVERLSIRKRLEII
jgi:hypothetical protein